MSTNTKKIEQAKVNLTMNGLQVSDNTGMSSPQLLLTFTPKQVFELIQQFSIEEISRINLKIEEFLVKKNLQNSASSTNLVTDKMIDEWNKHSSNEKEIKLTEKEMDQAIKNI